MTRSRLARILPALLLSAGTVVVSQESVELRTIDRIKDEAFARSEVMDHLRNLTDVHGPRLTGSPQFEEAAKWAVDRLTSYGLSNVHIERWGPFGRSWAIEQYSVEQIAPHYARLTAMPLAWSGSTPGPISGEPILTPLERSFDKGFKKIAENFAAYRREWSGKLRGKILLLTPLKPESPRKQPLFKRYDDSDLAETAKAPEPSALMRATKLDDLQWPEDPEELSKFFMALPESLLDELIDRFDALELEQSAFFVSEGVAGVLTADRRARGGLLAAEAAGSFHAKDPLAPPTFVVTSEQYDRLVRLIEQKQPVRVRLDLKVTASDKDVDGGNIVAEIPGGARKDEIVMVGAHFDSWHSGTGATDNGAGSAVMIEVMRILKALDLKLDRTVRLALWSGEEQGLL
jgi:carboxypeptidase Q